MDTFFLQCTIFFPEIIMNLDNKQVHSLCVDSRPGDQLRLAKGPLFLIPYSSLFC